MTLFPVILPVDTDVQRLSGREKVTGLSGCARRALRLSADMTGVILGEPCKDDDDIPLPFCGYHWSVSHKPKYAAAVIGKGRMGIDIEEIVPREEAIFGYAASNEEWNLLGGKSWDSFFRCWTAKEAVLKSTGTGLAGLKACRVADVPDSVSITLSYEGNLYTVAQLCHDGHIVSVVKNDNQVEWIVFNSSTERLRC